MTHKRPPSATLPPESKQTPARRRLYEAALTLFGEKGYHGVSVRDITDALGQQPGALYAHAASKQELLFELIRIGHEVHRDRLRTALLDAGRDPIDQISALVRAMVRANLDFQSLSRVANQDVRSLDKEQAATVRAIQSESERMLLEVIKRGQDLGVFLCPDPYLAMTAIAALGIRAAEWWTPRSAYSHRSIADTYATYSVRLLTDLPHTESI